MDRTLPMGDFILKLSGLNFFIITNKLSSTLDASHISVFSGYYGVCKTIQNTLQKEEKSKWKRDTK